MSNDNDHVSDTMAAPPLSQDDIETNPHASEAPLRDTQPPQADDAEALRVMGTILPGALRNPSAQADESDSVLMQAIKEVSIAARVMVEEQAERRAAHNAQLDMQNQILAEVRGAARTSDQNFETLRLSIKSLAESDKRQNERLEDGEKRFAAIEASIKDIRAELLAHFERAATEALEAAKRIEALEQELAAAKVQRDASQPSPATA